MLLWEEDLAKQRTDIFIQYRINTNFKNRLFSFNVVFINSIFNCISCTVNILQLNIRYNEILV